MSLSHRHGLLIGWEEEKDEQDRLVFGVSGWVSVRLDDFHSLTPAAPHIYRYRHVKFMFVYSKKEKRIGTECVRACLSVCVFVGGWVCVRVCVCVF